METFRCGHPRSPENTAKNGGTATACRTCKNARQKRQYDADLDRSRAAARERTMRYRRKNGVMPGHRNARKDVCSEGHPYDAENTYTDSNGWRQCKKCRAVAVREDYAKHHGKRLAERAVWRAANAELHAARARAWAAANPEKANLISRLKKQRRRAAGVLTAADWQSVLDLYGARCLACGSDDPPTIDHVIPISRGGTNTVNNVQPLCIDCNNRKGTKTIDYRPALAAV